jgi:Leucine-rich repeat (LRR) protein
MKLKFLNCSALNVTDFSWLQGMPLEALIMQFTGTSDLTPLNRLPLKNLDLSFNHVSDLPPLKGMSLESINICENPLTDLSPLNGIPLKSIVCGLTDPRDIEMLRSISTLEAINHKPVTEFWKKYDAGEFIKP